MCMSFFDGKWYPLVSNNFILPIGVIHLMLTVKNVVLLTSSYAPWLLNEARWPDRTWYKLVSSTLNRENVTLNRVAMHYTMDLSNI